MEDPSIWEKPDEAQALGQERATLEKIVETLTQVKSGVTDCLEMLELASEENDQELLDSIANDLQRLEKKLSALEFQRMFSGPMDANNAFIDIQSGSGGTEAQDWANMILRMYLRWAEEQGFKAELIEVSEGEVAGIKSATVKISGDYAFGLLRTETGVHRLVRKSPFDSGSRRHTSFASLFAYPEIDDNIEIEINPSELRIDTYRASGSGGQHVNKTDSAIRITHLPSGMVVECQDERSQHKNRASAMKVLQSRLLEAARSVQQKDEESTRRDLVGSGDRSERIRTYNFSQGRMTDHRINLTLYKLDEILEGDLDMLVSPLMSEYQADQLAAMATE